MCGVTAKMAPAFIEDEPLNMLNRVRFAVRPLHSILPANARTTFPLMGANFQSQKHPQGSSLDAYFHFLLKLPNPVFKTPTGMVPIHEPRPRQMDTALRCIPTHFPLSFLDVERVCLSKMSSSYGIYIQEPKRLPHRPLPPQLR